MEEGGVDGGIDRSIFRKLIIGKFTVVITVWIMEINSADKE